VSELYRIHLFERSAVGAVHEAPTEVDIPVATDLEPHISRMALWGGAVVTRDDAFEHEVTDRLPILTYHRVSPTGNLALDAYRVTPERFEQQLQYLRAHGYYGVTAERWASALEASQPLPGRAVMITFDDGYSDVAECAWPLLRDYEFPATVFVVADLVGTAASWDSRFGDPASLMTWDELRMLQYNGIEIGSHTARHLALTGQSPTAVLADETRARKLLRRELGRDVTAVAYPFGMHDDLSDVTMRKVGYRTGFTTVSLSSTVWDNPMAIPRIDVNGDDSIEVFAQKLGAPSPVNPLRRAVRKARSLRT
jgi:peptidoglycan/xylan/chitin deacetylase (PgdA/CDA1 family)